MYTAYVAVTILAIAANAGTAVADLTKAHTVLANADEVRVPRSWIPALGALKASGAAGLLIGLLGVDHIIGVAAAIGLVLFFAGAVAFHVRAGVYHSIAFPLAFLALAAAALALNLLR